MRREDPVIRFWRKVDKTDPSGCWLWRAATVRGYGQLNVDNGVRAYAHRFSYELHVGPVPDGLTLDHLCRTPACVNPDHLEPVTGAENTRRARAVAARPDRGGVCANGHPLTPEGSYFSPQGEWACRPCRRDAWARHDARRRQRDGQATTRSCTGLAMRDH